MSEPVKGLQLVKEGDPKVLPYRSPRARQEHIEYLGMIIFLCGWGMLYLGLFMAWAVSRSGAEAWPPPGAPRPPLGFGAVDTAVLLASSVALHLGVRALRGGRRARAVQAMVAALGLGGMFLALQAALWSDLLARGLTFDTGPYAELFYVLTGFQALHLGVAELALFWVLARTWRGLFNPARLQPVRLWALFWHAAAAMGALAFLLYDVA